MKLETPAPSLLSYFARLPKPWGPEQLDSDLAVNYTTVDGQNPA